MLTGVVRETHPSRMRVWRCADACHSQIHRNDWLSNPSFASRAPAAASPGAFTIGSAGRPYSNPLVRRLSAPVRWRPGLWVASRSTGRQLHTAQGGRGRWGAASSEVIIKAALCTGQGDSGKEALALGVQAGCPPSRGDIPGREGALGAPGRARTLCRALPAKKEAQGGCWVLGPHRGPDQGLPSVPVSVSPGCGGSPRRSEWL